MTITTPAHPNDAEGERVCVLTQSDYEAVRLLIDVADRYVIAVLESGVSTEGMEDIVDILRASQAVSTLVPLAVHP